MNTLKLENYACFNNIVINLAETCLIKFCNKNENSKDTKDLTSKTKKIVFSFNYTIKKMDNIIPNTFYVENFSKDDLSFMQSKYFKDNFIEYSANRFLNKNSIVSLRYNKDKGIIIFNLNHLHTYNRIDDKGHTEKVDIPEYVYKKASYEDYLKLIGKNV